MYRNFTSRNSIIKAALEELAADQAAGEGSEQPSSTEQVQSTNVENVDAVAELQERVVELEEQNGVMESDLIEANGDKVQDDLDEAIDSAVALESFGRLAMATYRSGTATTQSNAGIAIGLEHICSSMGMPNIVAAVEADGSDSHGDAAKNLGERALDASKKVLASVMAFFKKIKDYITSFFKEQINIFNRIVQVSKDVDAQLRDIKPGISIKDPAIKGLGLVSGNVYKDFKDYIEFSTSVMETLANENLYRSVSRLMSRDAAGDVSSVFDDVTSSIAKCFPMSREGNEGTTLETHDMMPGGLLYSFAYKKTAEGGFSCKVRATNIPVKEFDTVKTISASQTHELLGMITNWTPLLAKMNKTLARIDANVNINNADPSSPESVRTFMSVVTQLTTVLGPMVVRLNAQVARKFFTYVKIAQQTSTAPAEGASA